MAARRVYVRGTDQYEASGYLEDVRGESLVPFRRADKDEARRIGRELRNMLELSQELVQEHTNFIEIYEDWKENRMETIKSLEDVREKLKLVHMGCGFTRCAGAAADIIGTFAGIAELFATPGSKTSKNLTSINKALGHISTVATVSSTLIELGISEDVQDKVKQILQNDEKLFEPIKRSLAISRDLDANFQDIFGFSILHATAQDILKLLSSCKDLSESFKDLQNAGSLIFSVVEKCMSSGECRNFSDLQDVMQTTCKDIVKVFRIIRKDPRMLESITSIYTIFRGSPFIYEFFQLGLKLGLEFYAHKSFGLSTESCATVALVQTANIATNIISIILNATDMEENYSKYSKMLDDVIMKLKREFIYLSDIQTVKRNYAIYGD